jgi:adenylate kinase
MGPPGAGKGTQASHIATYYGIPAISTGDIFRANVSAGTHLGVTAQQYMNAGEYVPDDVTNGMVRARLLEPDAAAGFLLDGYPRTAAQVDELDDMLEATGHQLDAVVVLTVDTEELVGRLLNRAQVESRADDTADVIRRRQKVYVAETKALVDVYRVRGLVNEVGGSGEIGQVTDRILAGLRSPARSSAQSAQ